MVKIGKSPPRSLRIATRAAVAAALMAGASAAVATSAHAASPRMPQGSGCYPAIMSVETSVPTSAQGQLTESIPFGSGSGTVQVTIDFSNRTGGNPTVTGLDGTVPGSTCPSPNTYNTTNFGGTTTYTSASGETFHCVLDNSTVPNQFILNSSSSDVFRGSVKCTSGRDVNNFAFDTYFGSGQGAATPELGSGELLATGLLPLGIFLYRRRRQQAAK